MRGLLTTTEITELVSEHSFINRRCTEQISMIISTHASRKGSTNVSVRCVPRYLYIPIRREGGNANYQFREEVEEGTYNRIPNAFRVRARLPTGLEGDQLGRVNGD